MKDIDRLHDEAVIALADELLARSAQELREMPDVGSVPRTIAGRETTVGWWRWDRGEGTCHVVVQVTRPLRFRFYRKFTSGVAVDRDGSVRRLTREEEGEYD